MQHLNKILSQLEFAQIGWVVKDINISLEFFNSALGIGNFPPAERVSAEAIHLSYHGKVVPAEWLTTQTYHNHTFIELVQPLSGQSMFGDYLEQHPNGGIQHMAYRLPVEGFEKVCENLENLGYHSISSVDHPIARMKFFDTYNTLGVVTEIMGITPDGWKAIRQMEQQ